MESTTPADGWIAMVGSPIGNLEDITYRAVRTLSEADIIAAEDTRHSKILCKHFDIHTKMVSYHEHNEHARTDAFIDRVKQGEKIAVLSDAGMPVISDPGFLLAKRAREEDVGLHIIPGVSAVTHAIAAAGLPSDRFLFAGYPPTKKGKRRTFFEQLRTAEATVFLFESPYRITRLLQDVVDIIDPDIFVALVREATKIHEECLRGKAKDLLEENRDRRWRGEFVIGIDIRHKI